MFYHKHPYAPFIPDNATKLIVGTLPPPRFTTGELLEKDVNFCYGSCYNSLWTFMDAIFKLDLRYDNSNEAIQQRKQFLEDRGIGICDVVEACKRTKIDASDVGMLDVELRDVVGYLKKYTGITTLLFIGGSSKNGPEYFFRKHLKDYDMSLKKVANNTPKIHEFQLADRVVKTVSLTSSSGAANISIGSNPVYKLKKEQNPKYTPFDFRVDQYKLFF